MTIDERSLDEAIQHAREVAKHKRKKLDECNKKNNYACKFCIEIRTCKEVAEEHEQLAEWLEELKDYRDKNKMVVRIDCVNSEEFKDIAVKLAKEQYNKAIDDIKEKLMQNGFIYTQHALDVFNEIAEQLKAGESE